MMKMSRKTKILDRGALALVVVFLILGPSLNVYADILCETRIAISDIYKDSTANLAVTISNSTGSHNCITDNYGYVTCNPGVGVGNFSVNLTFCGNIYSFKVSVKSSCDVENLTLNISSSCQIPNSCNANENCSDNQNCYNGYCKNLNCNAGYTAKNHQCEFAIGCKIGAKVGARGGATSLQKVVEISNCTTLSEENKTYILTQDINTGDNAFINISADDIVIDCRWHKISGNGNGTGIKITGNNVIVENCIIENFSTGIMLNANDTTVYCNIIQNNSEGLSSGERNVHNKIYKNLIRDNEAGIHRLDVSVNISIAANEIIKNKFGIYAPFMNANKSPDLSNNVICSNEVNVNFTDYSNTSNCTLPDLAITKIDIPLMSDGNLTINVTAENLFKNLYNGSAIVSVIIEGNNQTTSENKTIDGNISIHNLSFNFSSLPSGIYFVTASIYSVSEINESNSQNNALSNAYAAIKENRCLVYGKTRHLKRLMPNINLTQIKLMPNINLTLINNSNNEEILNLTSDENGFFEIVLNEGNYTLKSIYSIYETVNVGKNSVVEKNVSVNLLTLNITDTRNISLENAEIVIIDANNSEGVVLLTNENGIAEFIYATGHSYKIFMFKEGYAPFHDIINQIYFGATYHIMAEDCTISSKNTSMFENYTLKIYNDIQNKIRQNKIERVISYVVGKKNMTRPAQKVGVRVGAKPITKTAKCYVNITNIPENLTVSVIENETNETSAKNSGFNGIEIVRIVKKTGNKTVPLGDVNINFTYKNKDFGNVIAESGNIGEQNLSYEIIHLDANETKKVGEKILYLPVKNNKGLICVNDNATSQSDINNMIENDCNGNWRIMNENDTVTFDNISYYYRVLSNGTGAVELNFVLGDANKNNMLDLGDVFKIIEHIFTFSSVPARADVNNDKTIDIFNVVEILENISG